MVKDNKGFTLVLALIILVLLSVMLGLFITMVTVNLRHANRFVAKSSIEQIANNGIEYCDRMLLTSAEGADWRPVPDNISMNDDWEMDDVNNPTWDIRNDIKDLSEKDPDYKWLVPYWPVELFNGQGVLYAGPDGGWTRMNSGDDRFLIRVTYAPVAKDIASDQYVANIYDTNSKFIKIECIARKGNIDTDDPTTMEPYTSSNNQYYLLAYKPIGITDYARFITNKDKQRRVFEIGNGRIKEEIGRINTRYTRRGGPIRVNGDVKFDNVDINLRALKHTAADGSTVYTPRDLVEVTGQIDGDNVEVYDNDFNNITSDVNMADFVKSSSDEGGFISDLEAPLVDGKIFDKSTTRYRQLTKNTGDLITEGQDKGRRLGDFGWGDGIYINNSGDVQKQSVTLYGGRNLRSDWIMPGNLTSESWFGPYYIPKGVIIELTPSGITVQRTDFSTQNASTIWRDKDGKLRPEWGSTCTFDYPKNGVLFAEGNIRIKGMLPEDTQLTVVSNENIYIDGNILKNRPNDTDILNGVDTEDKVIADKSSAISLLARKNVVVNTTMFMKPMMSVDRGFSDYGNNEPPYHLRLSSLDTGTSFQWQYQFGPYESEENLFDGKEWHLAIRHSSDQGTVDAFLQAYDYSRWDWRPIDWGEENSKYYSGVASYKNVIDGGTGIGVIGDSSWKYKSDIYKLYSTDFNNTFLGTNQYAKIFLGNESKGDYILGNIAINPMDVRIEALIYAQNGAFFVIPGYWYEPDFDKSNDNIWDFGKPLDIRIIVDGTVSENTCATKSDQISWMEKWGKTYNPDSNDSASPIYNKRSYHKGAGFTMLYDDTITYPLTGKEPIRYDNFGRILPITPKLPVSQTLIYKGIAE